MIMPDGSEQVFNIYAPGDSFGERALLSRDAFWTTVRVITDCMVLRIDAEEVLRLAGKYDKLEKGLEQRIYEKMRVHRSRRRAEKLGRVTVFCSMSEACRGDVIAHNTAAAVRSETGRTVLHMEVTPDPGGPTLTDDWDRLTTSGIEEIRRMEGAQKIESGFWQMRVRVSGEADDADLVASFISHLARLTRYLVLHIDPRVAGPVAQEFLIQSDLPYVLLTQQPEDIYRCHLLVRQLRDHPSGEFSNTLPMVSLQPDERAMPYETLDDKLGTEVHGFIHGLPGRESAGRVHDQSTSRVRISAHARQLAREIGRRRIGLALSAGGAKSLAHIGVIQVLEENGIDVDVVAGTSMGGLIGALWSHGIDGHAIAGIARRNRRLLGVWHLIDPAIPPRRGFIRGTVARKTVHAAIGDAHFSDMQRQLRIVATDLETLDRVVFDCGEVAPVVHASMAMPGIVVPVKLNGHTLIDGGVADPIPVDVLMEMGVERIIAVNTIPNPEEMKSCIIVNRENGKRPRWTPWRALNHYVNYFAKGNLLDVWARSMHGAETRVAEGACKQADIVLRPVSCEGRWHDFAHPDKYIDLGRMVAEERLDDIKALAR